MLPELQMVFPRGGRPITRDFRLSTRHAGFSLRIKVRIICCEAWAFYGYKGDDRRNTLNLKLLS